MVIGHMSKSESPTISERDWQLDPSAAIAPQITRIMRERIIQCDLNPGDRTSESEIARHYGVSRQPVRDAFIKLSDQGLLEVLPQRGTIVSRIGYHAVMDARFVRESIEADIVKILAANPDTTLIAELRRQIEAQQSLKGKDSRGFIRLDDAFHRTLADAASKSGVWRQIEGLKAQMDRVRYLSQTEFRIDMLIEQHRKVVSKIEAGDIAGANSAIRLHLREVLKDLPQIIETESRFFNLPGEDLPPPAKAPI